ncbi:MAG: hypothetical protein FWE33_07545, partial [Defluviitaleaceae bacterium]|nr:hypothetical protein [Defluviitaleaceae bacterium]
CVAFAQRKCKVSSFLPTNGQKLCHLPRQEIGAARFQNRSNDEHYAEVCGGDFTINTRQPQVLEGLKLTTKDIFGEEE